jgi:uncharacterized protein (DUF58 family)
VWLLVDLHPGMYFGSRLQLKSALAVRAAALLTWAAVRGGDRIGAVIAGPEVRTLPPRARDAGALPVLTALVAGQPRAAGERVAGALEAALAALVALVRPGSLVLALSDFAFLDDAADSAAPGAAANPWLALAARNECRLFAISDALERQGLPDGRFRAGLPGRLQLLDGAALRAPWLTAWQRRADRLGALALGLRAPLLSLDTAQDLRQSLVPRLRAGARAA